MEDGKELSCFRRYAFRPNIKPSDVLLDLEVLSTRKAAGANQICARNVNIGDLVQGNR